VDSRVAGKRFFQQHRALQRVCTRLGFGEHYLVDLVVTVPFSPAVQTVWTTGLP